jgi:hypothetical protein
MTQRKLALLAAVAVGISSGMIAHAQLTPAHRPFASLNELTKDADYIIIEIGGREYMATVGSSCFPESDHHCDSTSLGCHFYNAPTPPATVECVHCNGTSGVDHWCCPHPDEDVTCTNAAPPQSCGNRVDGVCAFPAKTCGTPTVTTYSCKVKPCS